MPNHISTLCTGNLHNFTLDYDSLIIISSRQQHFSLQLSNSRSRNGPRFLGRRKTHPANISMQMKVVHFYSGLGSQFLPYTCLLECLSRTTYLLHITWIYMINIKRILIIF